MRQQKSSRLPSEGECFFRQEMPDQPLGFIGLFVAIWLVPRATIVQAEDWLSELWSSSWDFASWLVNLNCRFDLDVFGSHPLRLA